jgi:Putative transmembrane protein (PGPGW)
VSRGSAVSELVERRRRRAPWYIRFPRMFLGLVITVIGVVLVPLPGPGWVIMAAGLSILAKDVA